MLVKAPVKQYRVVKRNFKTGDIESLVNEVLATDRDDTVGLARTIPRSMEGLKMLFDKVKNRIEYQEDPNGAQWVQTPSWLWHESRVGDCKSFTVLISTVLHNMGIPHVIRYVSYGTRDVKHVYPVAKVNGREIIMDVVYAIQRPEGAFNREKPYHYKKDKIVRVPQQGLIKIGNTDQLTEQQALRIVSRKQVQLIHELETLMADVPDSIITAGGYDVTQMTEGEFERISIAEEFEIDAHNAPDQLKKKQLMEASFALRNNNIAGIASTANNPYVNQVANILDRTSRKRGAFIAPLKVRIKDPSLRASPNVAGLLKKIGKGLKKIGKGIGKAVAKLHKKFMNWIFKDAGKKMGAFFLFTFITKKLSGRGSKEVNRRREKQIKVFNEIASKGKLDKAKLALEVKKGIKQDTGHDPSALLNFVAKSSISAVPALAVSAASFAPKAMKAVGWCSRVISKIVGIFKKKKALKARKEDASDLALLAEMEATEQVSNPNTASKKSAGESVDTGGGAGLAVGGLVGVLAVGKLLLAA